MICLLSPVSTLSSVENIGKRQTVEEPAAPSPVSSLRDLMALMEVGVTGHSHTFSPLRDQTTTTAAVIPAHRDEAQQTNTEKSVYV